MRGEQPDLWLRHARAIGHAAQVRNHEVGADVELRLGLKVLGQLAAHAERLRHREAAARPGACACPYAWAGCARLLTVGRRAGMPARGYVLATLTETLG